MCYLIRKSWNLNGWFHFIIITYGKKLSFFLLEGHKEVWNNVCYKRFVFELNFNQWSNKFISLHTFNKITNTINSLSRFVSHLETLLSFIFLLPISIVIPGLFLYIPFYFHFHFPVMVIVQSLKYIRKITFVHSSIIKYLIEHWYKITH